MGGGVTTKAPVTALAILLALGSVVGVRTNHNSAVPSHPAGLANTARPREGIQPTGSNHMPANSGTSADSLRVPWVVVTATSVGVLSAQSPICAATRGNAAVGSVYSALTFRSVSNSVLRAPSVNRYSCISKCPGWRAAKNTLVPEGAIVGSLTSSASPCDTNNRWVPESRSVSHRPSVSRPVSASTFVPPSTRWRPRTDGSLGAAMVSIQARSALTHRRTNPWSSEASGRLQSIRAGTVVVVLVTVAATVETWAGPATESPTGLPHPVASRMGAQMLNHRRCFMGSP